MPLTPRFSLRQTPSHVHIEISVPSFRLSAGADGGMEVVLMGENNSEFHFYAKPYLLKLNFFPNGFVDQDEDAKGQESGVGTAKYDPSEQTVTVPLLKQKQGNTGGGDDHDGSDDNYWPDLDLTARMIEPKEIPKKWLHSVVDESCGEEIIANDEEEEIGLEPGSSKNIPDNPLHSSGDGYGFANIFRNIFTDYCRSGLSEEMLQLTLDPEHSSIDERKDERLDHESKNFDLDRYLADLELCEDSTEDYLYPMVMAFEPWWKKSKYELKSTTTTSLVQDLDRLSINNNDGVNKKDVPSAVFSDDEKLLLTTIPYPLIPKELLSNSKQSYRLWCGLLELVLAYVYDHLATMGDATVESAWTIFVLSPGLSWLDSSPNKSVEKTTKTFLRRLLVYPYWRNAEGLGRKVLSESLELMRRSGIHGITKALLQIRSILDKSEVHYLGNKLFIDPYLYWIQNLQEGKESGLHRIISELATVVRDDKSFGRLVKDVESSLGIDAMMEEFFGTSDDEEEDDSVSSSSEEDSDSDSSSGDSSSSSDNDNDDQCEQGNIEGGDEKNTVKVQLLDDQIGHGTHGDGNILHCVGGIDPRTTAARPMITEMRSETNEKKTSLIQEI